MTDHSILGAGLPFEKEARLATRVTAAISSFANALFVDLPRAFAGAWRAQRLYSQLSVLDTYSLAQLGLDREGIGRYAIERAGLLDDVRK